MPSFSIIIVSHNKPKCVKEAVQSVLDQTHQDWEAVLIDSGVLLEQGFFDIIKTSASGSCKLERTRHRKTKLMPCWCH